MIEFKGDQQALISQLGKLSAELQAKALRSGLVRAAAPIKQSAKSLAPVHQPDPAAKRKRRPGTLAESIGHTTLTEQQRSNFVLIQGARGRVSVSNPGISIIIGPNRKVNGYSQGFVGSLMEFGVTPGARSRRVFGGTTLGRRGKSVRVVRSTAKYFHPGVTAKPFLAPALQANESQIESRFYQGIARYLKRIA